MVLCDVDKLHKSFITLYTIWQIVSDNILIHRIGIMNGKDLLDLQRLRWITPPFHQANPPTTASFLCAYRDTEHGCKYRAQIRRWHVPAALQ